MIVFDELYLFAFCAVAPITRNLREHKILTVTIGQMPMETSHVNRLDTQIMFKALSKQSIKALRPRGNVS